MHIDVGAWQLETTPRGEGIMTRTAAQLIRYSPKTPQ
jgi:hypothetical protein